ncbi:hypothetical protein, partial [Pseudomonas avellanae]|uniref:Uncharacterized protein n=6 Tax=Pseudomonas syringae group TaxID=136849 RepID=A0A3M2UYC0_PSEYM
MFPDVGCPQGRLMELNWHLSSIGARSWRNVLMMLVMDRLMILGQVFGFRDVFSLFLSTLMPLCSGFSSRLPACP